MRHCSRTRFQKQKMRLAAQKLLYGDDYKPDKKAEFEEAQVPLWGWAKDNDEDEGVTVFELQASACVDLVLVEPVCINRSCFLATV